MTHRYWRQDLLHQQRTYFILNLQPWDGRGVVFKVTETPRF